VTQIKEGFGISISPATGTGVVTITATGGGGGGGAAGNQTANTIDYVTLTLDAGTLLKEDKYKALAISGIPTGAKVVSAQLAINFNWVDQWTESLGALAISTS